MTTEEMQTIEAAIDEAAEALPNGDSQRLAAWVMKHRYPSFTSDLKEELVVKHLILRAPRTGRHAPGVTKNRALVVTAIRAIFKEKR